MTPYSPKGVNVKGKEKGKANTLLAQKKKKKGTEKGKALLAQENRKK